MQEGHQLTERLTLRSDPGGTGFLCWGCKDALRLQVILRAAPGALRVKNSGERNTQTGTGYKAPRESSLEKMRLKIWSWHPQVLEKKKGKERRCVWRER